MQCTHSCSALPASSSSKKNRKVLCAPVHYINLTERTTAARERGHVTRGDIRWPDMSMSSGQCPGELQLHPACAPTPLLNKWFHTTFYFSTGTWVSKSLKMLGSAQAEAGCPVPASALASRVDCLLFGAAQSGSQGNLCDSWSVAAAEDGAGAAARAGARPLSTSRIRALPAEYPFQANIGPQTSVNFDLTHKRGNYCFHNNNDNDNPHPLIKVKYLQPVDIYSETDCSLYPHYYKLCFKL